ncbi:hypothetical protein FOZ60_004124 [Perkinsus olseni]|uniref:Uncharacterized protein n=4 Tax=Perkinsus olseni TaxID=32597 RepID=A0A7J6PI59_PEROL|nr:hypothetical protein FOZ60_004124 [Perkinsus olseni]
MVMEDHTGVDHENSHQSYRRLSGGGQQLQQRPPRKMSRDAAETQAIVAEESELRSPLNVHPTSPSVSYMIKPQGRKKPLTLWGAVAIIFYSVSGGPFGTEDAVAAGGPFWALIGFLIFPLVWCLPEALVTAEMSSTFPSNCGYVSWVTAAFGPYWGFQEGFWSWLSGATDNAIYPHLLMSYLAVAFPILNEKLYSNIALVVLTLALTYVNYRGLKVVGWLAVVMMCFVLSPFIVFIIMGAPRVDPSNWLLERRDMEWTKWLNVLFWNLNYWDSVSTLAGEVENARSAMPKALLLALCLTCLAYILPLGIATGVDGSFALEGDQAFDAWQAGFLGKVAYDIGGWALGGWVVLAAVISNVGQYHAEMSSDSYQIQAMAEHGWLPEKLAYRNHHETPTIAICLQLCVILSLTTLNFLDIVELLNCIYCLAELLEFAAFLYLRYTNPNIWRPYTIPLGFWGCIILLLPPSVFICFILGAPFVNAEWSVIAFTVGAVVFGNILYLALQYCRKRKLLKFACHPPRDWIDIMRCNTPWRSFAEADQDEVSSLVL